MLSTELPLSLRSRLLGPKSRKSRTFQGLLLFWVFLEVWLQGSGPSSTVQMVEHSSPHPHPLTTLTGCLVSREAAQEGDGKILLGDGDLGVERGGVVQGRCQDAALSPLNHMGLSITHPFSPWCPRSFKREPCPLHPEPPCRVLVARTADRNRKYTSLHHVLTSGQDGAEQEGQQCHGLPIPTQ